MMSALEREVIEKFHHLDEEAQKRVRELIVQTTGTAQPADMPALDFDAWAAEVEAIRQDIRVSHGDRLPRIDVVDMLRDIRDGEDE